MYAYYSAVTVLNPKTQEIHVGKTTAEISLAGENFLNNPPVTTKSFVRRVPAYSTAHTGACQQNCGKILGHGKSKRPHKFGVTIQPGNRADFPLARGINHKKAKENVTQTTVPQMS